MKAVVIATSGDPQVRQVQEVENPGIGDDEVRIREGLAPYLGLKCSGIIEGVGKVVIRWKVGDQVCALLSGGGHAEKVAVPVGQVLLIPSGVSLKDAAGIPEVACTVWSTVLMMSRLSAGETFLEQGYLLQQMCASITRLKTLLHGLFIIGFQGGTVAEVNLSGLLARRLTVQAAGLRNRSLENKDVIVSEVEKNVWPATTGVQIFSIDGSSRGSPAHGK
ncbi:hypothetical protein PVL29_011964 [Vitis rotundifolia]|uniref:Enoyl reductase (ER) domain-containing protein n=1 Tax=Vitis rotundifolia TaxID=103349 RepID=A0AA39DSY6_VITRO|nr:hypothetical protein PVL29_011964 [Vitis rotundifolia]